MGKRCHVIMIAVLSTMLVLPNVVQATESVKETHGIDVNRSEKSHKIQSYKKGHHQLKDQMSTDTLVVKYNKKLSKNVHTQAGTKVVRSIPSLGYDVVKLDKGKDVSKVIRYYANVKNVASVQPSMKYTQFGETGDPKKEEMYHLSLLNIDEALQLAGDHAVTVAVIDTGIDKNHPELKSQILPPYNAVNPASGQALDIHGTHVAGIIGAEMNNGIGGHGVNPFAKILPIDVFNGDWGASDYVLAEAIVYAIKQDVDVINMSLGGYYDSSIFKEAVQQAIDAGITVVAAAGNEATDDYSYPASYKGVISVGSIDKNKRLASDSNYGPSVNLVAPGVDVYSTAYNPLKGSSFMEASGTSMASPVVAGVAGLVKSKYPDLRPADVRALLEHTATDLGDKGYDHTFGHGLVNPVQALTFDVEKLPKRADTIAETKMLHVAKKLKLKKGKQTIKGSFTKSGAADYYRLGVRKGDKIQTVLSGSKLYDYQYELIFVPKKGKPYEPIVVNDVKTDREEGYLYGAERSGTLVMKVVDANGNYNVNGKSNYTLHVNKKKNVLIDDVSIDNMMPVKLPYKSTEDKRGPFTLISEDKEVADYDYFTFSVKKKQLVSIQLVGLPGVNTSLAVYDEAFFEGYDEEESADFYFEEEEDWIAMASKNGFGGAEKLVFTAEPGTTYVLEVAGEPKFSEYDWFDFFFDDMAEEDLPIGRSSQPYELTMKKVVLPPDEDGVPNEDFDSFFDEEWFEELDCEQGNCQEFDDERIFEKGQVDLILKNAVSFQVGEGKKGYYQTEEDEDYYQLQSTEDAIYKVNVKGGDDHHQFVIVYEYDKVTHDFIPITELFHPFEGASTLTGAVALQANKKYVVQLMNMEGISADPYELKIERIGNVPASKSADKSKPERAKEVKSGTTYTDYFVYDFEHYYFFKNKAESQIYSVHALPEKLTQKEQASLPSLVNNDLIIGMAIIEDTNGNKKIDPKEEDKVVEFYPNYLDSSLIVNGSFTAKKDVGYFIALVNFTEGLSVQQYSLEVNDITRVDEDHDSVVKNNVPSKPLPLQRKQNRFVGKGYFNAGVPYGDKDYYLLDVGSESSTTFMLQAGPGLDGVIKVYNEKGVLVGNLDYYGPSDDEVGTLTLPRGKYYVEVSEATDAPSVTPYELSIVLK